MLELPDRACLHCGNPIKLICNRDLDRKKYCSHRCRMLHRYKQAPWDMRPVIEKSHGTDKRPVKSKVCPCCENEYLPITGNQHWCLTCVPDKRARNVLDRYGITYPEFMILLAKQDGKCAICQGEIDRDTANIDHDHACCSGSKTCGSCTRGLLCNRCNVGLHYVEKKGWLDNASSYLNRS